MSAFSNEQAVSPKARATQAGTEHEPGGRGCTAEPAGGYASGGYGLAVDSSSAWPPCALAAPGTHCGQSEAVLCWRQIWLGEWRSSFLSRGTPVAECLLIKATVR